MRAFKYCAFIVYLKSHNSKDPKVNLFKWHIEVYLHVNRVGFV